MATVAYKFLNEIGLTHIFTIVKDALKGKSDTNHTHLYAGSSSVGGVATSAEKLTKNAGSATQPIYFSNGVPVNTKYELNATVPSGAKFTDTVYTLPNATSSTLGGVKVGTNISVSSGTISVANASTSAKGVVQLSNAVNSTSTSLAATASAVKSAYDLANGKQSPATTLAGYGITNAYTKTEVDAKIPTSLPANGGNAATVGGFTVGTNVPANAKFTDTVYTLPTASSTLGGVKTTSTVTSTSGLTACPIISGVPYYKDTNTQYTLGSFSVTATATELNVLDGITATTAELNYCDGVTSNIQTQLNGKLSTSGTAAKATADASGNNIVNTYAKKSTTLKGYGITNAYTKTEVDDLINALQAKITELESKIPSGSLATVATTGSYKDLKDLPTKLNEIKDY